MLVPKLPRVSQLWDETALLCKGQGETRDQGRDKPVQIGRWQFFIFKKYLSHLSTQSGAQTHSPAIRSCALLPLSQPGTLVVFVGEGAYIRGLSWAAAIRVRSLSAKS